MPNYCVSFLLKANSRRGSTAAIRPHEYWWVGSPGHKSTLHINIDDREGFCFFILFFFYSFRTKWSQCKQKRFSYIVQFHQTNKSLLLQTFTTCVQCQWSNTERQTFSFILSFNLATARTCVPPFKYMCWANIKVATTFNVMRCMFHSESFASCDLHPPLESSILGGGFYKRSPAWQQHGQRQTKEAERKINVCKASCMLSHLSW